MKKRILLICSIVLIVFSIASCSAKPELTGLWVTETYYGSSYIQFNEDGTGTSDGDAITWEADGNQLTIVTDRGTEMVFSYELTENTLVITKDGTSATLQRG